MIRLQSESAHGKELAEMKARISELEEHNRQCILQMESAKTVGVALSGMRFVVIEAVYVCWYRRCC